MKRYDAWSEPDPQCNFGGGRCELYERTLGQYVTFDDHERAIAAVMAECDRLAAENAELRRRLDAVVAIFNHDEDNQHNSIGRYQLYDIAVAIAEGRNNG